MNAEQTRVFEAVFRGHNVYIGGRAGCGKSFLISEIVSAARKAGKSVALTCTTGVACCCFSQSLQPMTLHKWAGLRDGRFSGKKLVSLLDGDIYYEPAKDRMKHVDILIIDEISMLSAASLDNLESVMRHVRELEKLFGGAQVVLVGDFLQLPPVANQRYQDPGEFCFSSPSFPAHRLFLSEKMRHTDKALADIVAAVSVGSVAPDIEAQIRRLSRPLAGTNSTKMFATNIQADIYNRDQLVQMDGPMYEFVAVDEGRETELNRLVVQKTLWLKDAAAVMLLRNLSDRLVNGLQGTVSAVREGEVDVFFPTLQKTHTLSRMHFTEMFGVAL